MIVRFVALLLAVLIGTGCGTRPDAESTSKAAQRPDSVRNAAAIDMAAQRIREHGQLGFSLDDLRRTREWFTPELFALLLRDMSGPGEGYLDEDPFLDAQDIVGPFRFEDVRRAGDTVLVRFSRLGYPQKRDSVTLAMRQVGDTWRIANFLYTGHSPCYRDLARGLTRFAQNVAAKRAPDYGCVG